MESRALTTGEIGRYCGVHLRTVLRWIERGHLKAYQLPGRGDNRIPLEEFLSFLRAHNMPLPRELQPAGRRVLIVEDDELMAKSMERLLRRAGYHTAVAPDGLRAGLMLETFKPQLMTLDLTMPGMSGLEVLAVIRATPSQSTLRVLVVSAAASSELEAARAAGADDVLEKPFETTVLLRKLQALLPAAPERALA